MLPSSSSRPSLAAAFTEQQLKQLRAQCLVFLAFRYQNQAPSTCSSLTHFMFTHQLRFSINKCRSSSTAVVVVGISDHPERYEYDLGDD